MNNIDYDNFIKTFLTVLDKQAKKQYFSNLEPKHITDNKKFQKSVKPLFPDKITMTEIINLTENGETLSLDTDIADTFNDYLSSVVQNLNIPRENSMLSTDLFVNPVFGI